MDNKRCEECGNVNAPWERVCDAGPEVSGLDQQCRFVREYEDARGWRYKVMGGIGQDSYKARFRKPGEKAGIACSSYAGEYFLTERSKTLMTMPRSAAGGL